MWSLIKSTVLDNDGTVNPAHIITIALTAAIIAWGTHVAIHTHAMPELTGAAALLGGGAAVNVAHKAEDIVAKIKE
jgi:hypothetical protein